jgi:pectin methylesterase-like acyl-CoA thioesterase
VTSLNGLTNGLTMRRTKSAARFSSSILPIVAVCCMPIACSSNEAAPVAGTGGHTTGGANTASGGSSGAGGALSSGGVSSSGGAVGTGGKVGSGGGAGSATGGSSGKLDASVGQDGTFDSGPAAGSTGGITGTGGATIIVTGGRTGTGGTGTGTLAGTGGKVGSGGATGTGGAGTGGATGAGDSLCPPGITQTITVAKDGSGQFSTVQAAVDSIPSGSSTHIRIDIKAGTYTEKLTIASRTNLCLVGAGNTSTILAYGDSNSKVGSTSGSASVHISANDFSAANLTMQNTFGSGSQAVALRTTGQRQQFLNCRFVGYQDTLYTHNGMQYFRNCYVQGNTDYVFGGATAVLEDCEARNVENGSAVAAPNTDAGTAYGIVFLGGKMTAVSGVKSVALGRPWGAAGFAAFLNMDLGSHILAAGFVDMSGNSPANARFHEYGSTGSGANTSSRSSYQLSASQAAGYTLANILGSWTPSYSK